MPQMQYVNLGRTGLKVSRLCLGCMSFGAPGSGRHGGWTLDEDASRAIIRQAIDAGINFFDTANIYSDGESEEIVGRALRDLGRRDELVIATKAYAPWRNAPNTGGLSRKAILQALDDSLARLGTDYVDLYQIHRWDHHTPIEETLEALHDVVRAGKVRYIGASSMYAWQFAKALYTAAPGTGLGTMTHVTKEDIEAGRVDYAIAGGVNMILGNDFTDRMRDSGFLSRDDRCKTFDDSANGYVRAEGGGLVLLANKNLVSNYYAELLGSAINQNGGRSSIISAPHPEAQEELIVDACRDAAIRGARAKGHHAEAIGSSSEPLYNLRDAALSHSVAVTGV